MSLAPDRLIFLAHLASTWFMAGLIWFVQVVHYPLFDGVGREAFAEYESRHAARTTWVVGPPMLVEAASAILLLWLHPAGVAEWQAWTGLGLLAPIWISTALVQVPCHDRLAAGFDASTHRRLVATNWLRTAAWTARGALVLGMCWSLPG